MRFIWRLESRIEASDERLESAGESCVRWEFWCGLGLVVSGLLGEFVIACVHPPYDSFWDRWGGVVCDALIALGVVGEIYFSSLSHKYSGELTRRSNRRLADVIEATQWRVPTSAQRNAIAEALKASGPRASVQFTVLTGDTESMYFAKQIGIAFKDAGWQVGYSIESYRQEILSGIMLPTESVSWLDEMRVVNRRVRDAFIAAQVKFADGWPSEPVQQTGGGEPLFTPIASVYVGPKPTPLL